ncbi:MAG TPA: endonuclease/exonuclease/phosphatase family protein, partial [Burkholderiaceae bacterium]|nr:endonuclease/exonuclease/phosphatase family protein [Burkholderiaceae bacterium]
SHVTRLFRRVSDTLDPRIGRRLYASFNARRPLLRWPLDHIFFSEEFRLVRLERQRYIGSDHFPMLVEVSYEPEGAAEQRQVENARIALQHNLGLGGACVVTMYQAG